MRRISMRRQHAWVLTGLILVTVLAVAGLGVASRASAQTTFSVESIGGQIGLGDADLRQVVLNVIRWVLGILTLTAVVYMMYGGYLWLTAAGNEKRVEKAKQVILQAAIGLVIVLLAWAIVLFVTRSLANVTNTSNPDGGSTGGTCNPLIEECGEVTAFDVTNIASCAVGDANSNVPRSSAIQLTFNANLKDGAVQQAVADDVTNANPPNLIVQKCANNDCANPANLSTPVPLENQRFISGTKPTTTGTPPQADWTQKGKVVTFYHVANDTLAADARLFEPNQKYLLTIPAKDASKALLDVNDRKVQNCRRQTSDIAGLPGCDASGTDRITWEFTTGADTDGPALSVASAYPSFAYQTSTVSPNRSVDRSSFLSIQYNTPIDFNTLTADNFKVFKCGTTNIPSATNDWNECDDETANQIPSSNFVVEPRPDGRGGLLRLVSPALYEAFTWYKVEVSNVRSLCGRVQEPPTKTWVFQTNDAVPGVKKVYPRDGYQNACPATKVFIQYATSMWDGSSFDCNVGGGSYVSRGLMTNNPGRTLIPSSVFDANDPKTCTMYEFSSTSTLLPPNTNFEARVESDLVIDTNGRKLNYGYTVAGSTSEGPWAFKTATASTCAQEPVIIKVSPGQGPDGLCLSVIGDYFEKVNLADTNTDRPDAGDGLTLRARNQTADTWTNDFIVSSVDAGPTGGGLTRNASHPYVVTVNYPAPIGPLVSSPENFYLTDDPASQGPCLTKISPTQGPVNTTVVATGKRLGTGGQVEYSTKIPPNWTVAGSWTDTRIDGINVDPGSPGGRGDVTVVTGGQVSNPLPYTVKTVVDAPGTAPRVVETTTCSSTTTPSPNPRRDEAAACINAWPSARFTVEMDPATLNQTNIRLESCDAGYTTCAPVVAVVDADANNRGFKIKPTANLLPATAYRVTISGVTSADAVPMAGIYQWRFTTKAGNVECPIDRLVINQSDRVFNRAFTLGLPTSVTDSACNEIDGSGLTYAWNNSDPTICALIPGHTGYQNICRSDDPLVVEGETRVRASLPSENITSNEVKITADLVACETSAQCACGGNLSSQCVGGKCQPVVTSISPNNGRVGTWATIEGCWFGTYNAANSKVVFSDNKEGIVPVSASNACTAGNTWTNTQIIREVPTLEEPTNDVTNDAVTGPVRVVRRDQVSVSSSPLEFQISPEEYPKICRIDPSSRRPGEVATVYGKDLGTDQGSGDSLTLSDDDTTTVTPFAGYPQWDADRIGVVAPNPGVGLNVYGAGKVRVTHLGKTSNPLAMTLVDPTAGGGTGSCAAADLCVDDSTCGTGRGCGFDHCCATRPVVTATRPLAGETDVCRNTQVQVDFSQPLLPASVTSATFRYLDGAQVVQGKVGLLSNRTTVTYTPGLLSPNSIQSLKLTPADGQSTLLRGVTGVLADIPSSFSLGFTSSAAICALDRVVVTPASKILTATGQTYSPDPLAQAFSGRRSAPLSEVPGVYEWDWRWERVGGSDAIATVQNQNSPTTTIQAGTTRGKIAAKATAKVTVDNNNNATVNREASGQTSVTVDFCENPWVFTDQAANCTANPNPGSTAEDACPSFHMKLYYCASASEPLLNHQAIEGRNRVDPARKKSFFFKESEASQDAIGVLVFANPELLSPYDWFKDRFPGVNPGSSTTIGGYPAVRTGTTAYIGVTDLTDAGQLAGYMFVIDFNSNSASSSTQSIYNRILSTIEFNATQSLSDDDRAAIVSDTQRVQDLRSIKSLLEVYKTANSRYPDLPAGSFIPGFTTSTWPSWQRELANALGRTLPSDPTNGFAPGVCQAPYEAASCWAESTRQFQCPVGSQIYSYKTLNGGSSYELFANLKYTGAGGFNNFTGNPCTGLGTNNSTCACFNYRVTP